MTTEQWKAFLKYIREHFDSRSITLCVTGGEPMLRSDFYEIMKYAQRQGLKWGMTTNGTLITEDDVPKLVHSGMKTVSISVDGLEEYHDQFRHSKGSFQKAIESLFPCRILCFDDADMTLAGKDATQQEIAYIVKRLTEKRKVIFLGINLKKRCGTLLRIIGEDSYEFFHFDKKQNHREKGHIGESDYESALLLDCCNLKVGNWYHFCPRCGKKIDLETCKTIQVPVPNTIDLFDYITWECSCGKGYERYGYNYCPICGKEREK